MFVWWVLVLRGMLLLGGEFLLCGDAMWGVLIVFFLFLEFLEICFSLSFLDVVLL